MESPDLVGLRVIEKWEIWIDGRLPIRLFAFRNKSHYDHSAKAYAKERRELPSKGLYKANAIYIFLSTRPLTNSLIAFFFLALDIWYSVPLIGASL